MSSFRFAVSRPLGKLAKWLRIMGFDTMYEPDCQTDLRDYQTGKERIIVCRSHSKKNAPNLVENRLSVVSDDPLEQLKEVIACLSISVEMVRLFTLCIRCNQKTHGVQRRGVKGRVPDYVWTTAKEFRMCPACRRIYWSGSHMERMQQRIEGLFYTKTASEKEGGHLI